MTKFDEFVNGLVTILNLPEIDAIRLAELLDDRMKEISEEAASDMRDSIQRRGRYDPDY